MNKETLYVAMANVKALSAVADGLNTMLASNIFETFDKKVVNVRLLNAFKALETDDDKWYIRLDDNMFKNKETVIRYKIMSRVRCIEVKEKSYDRAVYASQDAGYIRYVGTVNDEGRLDGSSLRTEFERALEQVEAWLRADEDLVKNFDRYCMEYNAICKKMAEVSEEFDKLPPTFRNSNQLNRWGN